MTKENFKPELNKIHVTAKNNGYATDLVNNILLKKKKI